jgi:5-aminolevulinate synthase
LLAAEAPERPKLMVFEALYSMDGDVLAAKGTHSRLSP